jgi:ssDNA-binding Zn-finger/Zn-ribbon topoisomerase 1
MSGESGKHDEETDLNCAVCHSPGMQIVSSDGAMTTVRCSNPECGHEATFSTVAPL